MQIDTPMLAIIITILTGFFGLAVAWGALGQKVKKHDKEIEQLHKENREDHRQLFNKMEEINAYLRNAKG